MEGREGALMKEIASAAMVVSCFLSVLTGLVAAQVGESKDTGNVKWPTYGWARDSPANVGLDEKVLAALDSVLASGKYSWVDSFAVVRCGTEVFERTYSHDYGTIYAKEAMTRGPLNAHLTGWYNYFDSAWHPYYQGSDLHSMQSVSKTVSSIILGIAITRGDFKAGLDTPLLKYFDVAKVKNVDERKRRITLHHVLTMSTGLDWNEDVSYDDPRNDSSLMEATDDWVQYVIDKPMAQEPGKVFNYSSGASALLAYIFQKETGQDIERYGDKYLFTPLGMDHFWKPTPLGLPDTEGGVFLNTKDFAKLGYLYLHDGMWDGKQIVSKEWVKQSLAPSIDTGEGHKYGYQWWLLPRTDRPGYVWMALGLGGQILMVFPEEDLVAVVTGWEIIKDNDSEDREIISQILSAVRAQNCPSAPH
jgi:CubicO group peptidase (beta-lactamase class C family)